jgi:DNA mismatch repair ATPase MutS
VKVFLLHRDRDFDVREELRDSIYEAMVSGDLFAIANIWRNIERKGNAGVVVSSLGRDDPLTQDLELETLWKAMAGEDEFLFETAKRAILSSLGDPEEIVYRQRVLADCLEHPEIVRQIYELAMEALESERQVGSLWHDAGPDRILSRSVEILTRHVDLLKRLRKLAEDQAEAFGSEGFKRFFAMLQVELDDDYLQTVERHLKELRFGRGVPMSAQLTRGNKAKRYTVRKLRERSWSERLLPGGRSPSYSFTLPPRDENGFKALEEIRGKGINQVANAVAQSADHVKSFFAMLRLELAFYLGCLNLRERLDAKAQSTSVPNPVPADATTFACEGLYDVCLTLHLDDRVVGNDVDADGKSLVVITGANQGGKSTFLRSAGLAQLMMQAGMFVGAQSLRANVSAGVFTHYKREEDVEMEGGKLDEELSRMSEIADKIEPTSLLLCNESFASTNEREGSEIARQVVRAMLEKRIKVFFVTHMFDLAHSFYDQGLDSALFLRAERKPDGTRTFRVVPGEPLSTSYGEDSYRRIFGKSQDAAVAGGTPRGTSEPDG